MSLFESLGLKEELIKGVKELGFDTPTPIQKEVIPVLIAEDRDVVGLAQTGTGKTAAFGLPLLHKIDTSDNRIQALVLSPTRELGIQIAKDFENFGKFDKKLKVATVYGGASISDQIRKIKKGVQVVVATPGRLGDLIRRKAIHLGEVEIVVLDEADEMLNMGFKDELDFILGQTPDHKSTWLFSATMPKEVSRIAKQYMNDPLEVEAGERNTSARNIEHKYYLVSARDRYEALKRLVDNNPSIFGLIFCQTKRQTQEVAENLMRDGYNADSLHGDLSQAQRDRVMHRFRERQIQILVATDVAARGIDVDNITHVIHYSVPDDIEAYTHRSGRTARAGRQGQSLCIVTNRDLYKIKQIERIIKSTFKADRIPTGGDVCEQQMFALIDKVKEVEVNPDDVDAFMPRIAEQLAGFTADEIIAKFISLEFNRFLEYYKDSVDINAKKGREGRERNDRGRDRDSRGGRDRREPRGDRGDRGGRERGGRDRDRGGRDGGRSQSKPGYTLCYTNVGRNDNMNPGQFINWICTSLNFRGKSIGAIRIKDQFTFFEVEDNQVDVMMKNRSGLSFEGKKVKVEIAKN